MPTATSRPMPTTVLLASDNCVRESKNSHVLSYLVSLCAHYKVRCSGLINLRKSHTHDVIDQLWGVLARRIARCDKLLSPQSVISVLVAELERPGLKGWIGTSTLVRVYKLDCVRPWNRHYNEQRVGLSGGLRSDDSANHVFINMLRRGQAITTLSFKGIRNIQFGSFCNCFLVHRFLADLPECLQNLVDAGTSRAQPSPYDVIMLIKTYMGSDNLAQAPLLVLTAARVQRATVAPSALNKLLGWKCVSS